MNFLMQFQSQFKKESQFYEKYYKGGKDYKIKEKFINADHKDMKQ